MHHAKYQGVEYFIVGFERLGSSGQVLGAEKRWLGDQPPLFLHVCPSPSPTPPGHGLAQTPDLDHNPSFPCCTGDVAMFQRSGREMTSGLTSTRFLELMLLQNEREKWDGMDLQGQEPRVLGGDRGSGA
jgi:hypothetical protein